MKYFIAPRSGERSYKNFQSTIKNGVPYENIEPYLTGGGKRLLLAEDVIYAWGNRAGTRGQWENMEDGDIVIFYSKGELVMTGEVYYKQHSDDLALAMWPRDENGNPWSYTFFIKNIKYFKMPMRTFNWAAGYKSNFIVQGFIPLKPDRVRAIEKQYGSVDNLLNIFATSVSEEIPTVREKLYVNVPKDTDIRVRSSDDLTPKQKNIITVKPSETTPKPKKIDYEASNKTKAILGSRGEAIAMKYEQQRLERLGLHSLAKQVHRVSVDNDSLGYDIKSFNSDGSTRHIEVKTSSVISNNVRFFMSANEMQKSIDLENYFVYYVDAINTKTPRITTIKAPMDRRCSISTDTYILEASA